jgi:hypothetical protein
LKPYIRKDSSFKDLRENKDQQDISYLANKTGWDARLVAMVSLAEKYSAENGIPISFGTKLLTFFNYSVPCISLTFIFGKMCFTSLKLLKSGILFSLNDAERENLLMNGIAIYLLRT